MKKSLLLVLILIGQIYLFGQDKSNIYIHASYSKGFILPHHQSFNYFIKDYVDAFNIRISKQVNGNKDWHKLYNLPDVGFGYSYFNFGNKEQLGTANVIYPFISFSLVNRKYCNLRLDCASGVAWLSKRFDIHANMYNIAIGSHMNAYLNISSNLDIKLNDKGFLYLGIGLTHFSNGATQKPNKGLNIIGLKSGFKYYINGYKKNAVKIDSLSKFVKKNEFSIIYAGGLKTLEPARREKYFIQSLSFNLERNISHKNRLGIGVDMFNDNSQFDYLKLKQKTQAGVKDAQQIDNYYAGGHLSYDLVFGKTSFTVQMGAYFWQRAKSYQSVYHRFGFKYRFSKHWMANLTLKTFWAAADFAEWGIGYRL